MSGDHPSPGHPAETLATSDEPRYKVASRATWASVWVNVALTVVQLVIGFTAHSKSLVAHGLHSFSDLLSDFLVLYANRHGSNPADAEHPYGHGRFETAATLVLGISLFLVGGGILWDASLRLQVMGEQPPVEMAAFWAAVATVVCKEGLYHYLIRVAERLRSPLLAANAMHTRADAASALVVVAGIGGSLMGWGWLDLAAAALMGYMILHMGAKFAWQAMRELIDTALDEETVAKIRATLMVTPGVVSVHELRTRRMAHQALVDAHIQVDSRISVSEGHRIADASRRRVLAAHSDVMDVLVHVDAEDDIQPAVRSSVLPGRVELTGVLRELLGEGVPEPEKTVLHYLGNRIEAEIFLPPGFCADAHRMEAVRRRLAERLAEYEYFSSVSLNCRVAP